MIFERMKGHFLREHQSGRYVGGQADIFSETGSARKFGLSPVESLLSGMVAGTFSVVFTCKLSDRALLCSGCRQWTFSNTVSVVSIPVFFKMVIRSPRFDASTNGGDEETQGTILCE
jgi:hypothetical protein